MHVDRHIELLGAAQQRCKPRIVEEGAADSAADQSAAESEIPDRPFKLVRSCLRNASCEMRERRKTIRVFRQFAMRRVVKVSREGDRLGAVEHVGARPHVVAGFGDDLHRDAGSVHISQSAGAQIFDLVGDPADDHRHFIVVGNARNLGIDQTVDARSRNGKAEMFLQSNDTHSSSQSGSISIEFPFRCGSIIAEISGPNSRAGTNCLRHVARDDTSVRQHRDPIGKCKNHIEIVLYQNNRLFLTDFVQQAN